MDSEQQIIKTLMSAAKDPRRWEDALRLLCKSTGADKALITVRELKTAELIIPTSVEEEYRSPLIYGFSEEDVYDYLINYAKHDPWTNIERRNHPYTPYAFSRYLPIDELKSSRYWEWLSPQGINDAITVEIFHTDRFWVALNLYFKNDGSSADPIIRKLKRYLSILSISWSLTRELWLARIDQSSWFRLLDHVQCLALNFEKGKYRVEKSNGLASLFEGGILKESASQGGFSIAENVPLFYEGSVLSPIETHAAIEGGEDYICTYIAPETPEHISGETAHKAILVFDMKSKDRDENLLWEHPALSPREATIVHSVCHGNNIQDVAPILNLSERQTRSIWRDAMEKLGLSKKSELLEIMRKKAKT